MRIDTERMTASDIREMIEENARNGSVNRCLDVGMMNRRQLRRLRREVKSEAKKRSRKNGR